MVSFTFFRSCSHFHFSLLNLRTREILILLRYDAIIWRHRFWNVANASDLSFWVLIRSIIVQIEFVLLLFIEYTIQMTKKHNADLQRKPPHSYTCFAIFFVSFRLTSWLLTAIQSLFNHIFPFWYGWRHLMPSQVCSVTLHIYRFY